jgi:hypothetical protein
MNSTLYNRPDELGPSRAERLMSCSGVAGSVWGFLELYVLLVVTFWINAAGDCRQNVTLSIDVLPIDHGEQH